MASAGEAARRAYAEYMGSNNKSSDATQQQQQPGQPYAGQGLLNPYAGFGPGVTPFVNPYATQQYSGFNQV